MVLRLLVQGHPLRSQILACLRTYLAWLWGKAILRGGVDCIKKTGDFRVKLAWTFLWFKKPFSHWHYYWSAAFPESDGTESPGEGGSPSFLQSGLRMSAASVPPSSYPGRDPQAWMPLSSWLCSRSRGSQMFTTSHGSCGALLIDVKSKS